MNSWWSFSLLVAALLTSASAPADPAAPAPPPAPASPPVLLPGDAPVEEATTTAPPAVAAPAAPRPPAATAQSTQLKLDSAVVQLIADYPGAWLELRSLSAPGGFARVCPAPCDVPLRIADSEARVTAPGMTPSNPFRIEPGLGTARLSVAGGSDSLRSIGVIALGAGIPVTLAGGGLYGYGRVKESSPLQITGVIVLVLGGASVLASLPLLYAGSTRVRDGRGRVIARQEFLAAF